MTTKCYVDLRSRRTGNTETTLLVTEDANLAWDLVRAWNKSNLVGYEEDRDLSTYVDGSDGLFADCYYVSL